MLLKRFELLDWTPGPLTLADMPVGVACVTSFVSDCVRKVRRRGLDGCEYQSPSGDWLPTTHKSSDCTVHALAYSSDPLPTPKYETLADVPEFVVCKCESHSDLYFRIGNKAWVLGSRGWFADSTATASYYRNPRPIGKRSVVEWEDSQ